ncbi:GNAT family N-acetyltransferase [Clostridium subterminale]|uniref:N-acetyltransferase domain-containing protein n=1 Tax=Clostridium subterminale TaxID=1550 RepID=A0ABP3VPM4_CLOSU
MGIKIARVTVEDTNDLIEIQNKAFYSDFKKYGECPGYNRSYESMKSSIENAITFKILVDDIIVGDIIVSDRQNGEYHLGGLCVIPEYENRGLGQKAIAFLDSYFPNAKHWSLETPADKERNHYFYKKCGFKVTGEFMDGNVKVVVFEKDM